MCVSVCKCDECSFFNYCINMDFESVNKDLFIYLFSSPPFICTSDTQDCIESLCSTTQYVKTNNSCEADNFDLCQQPDYVPDIPSTSEISSIDNFHTAVYSPVSSCYDILKSSNSLSVVVPSHVVKVKHSSTNMPFVSILGQFSLWFALSALVFYVVFSKY